MCKEEKQAIKKFENLLKKHFEDKKIDTLDYLDYFEGITILNLIEKQQKEIEELKKEKRILIEKYTEVVYECGKRKEEIEKLKSKKYILNAETNEIKEIPISDDYISKDKIREIISKYIDIEEHLVYHHQELWGVDLAEMIKELLGE